MSELETLQQQIRSQEEGESHGIALKDIVVLAKSALFCFITAKLAFGNDKSYIGADEWFPKKYEHETLYDVSEEEQKESDETDTKSSHRDKKTK